MTIAPEFALSSKNGHGDAVRVAWGLVQIPVRIFIVTDAGSSVPSRSMFTAEGDPVGNRPYNKVTEANVTAAEIVKRVAVGEKWVDLTDDEIAANSTLTKGLAEIATFIPMASIGSQYAVERSGAWMPDRIQVGKNKMVDPTAAKASALLRAAMAERDVAALVLVPSKSGGKYVALCPDGQALTLSFADQVRPIVDTAADIDVTAQEMGLAMQLIDGIGVSAPVLVDQAGELLRTYLAAKAEGVIAPVTVSAPEAAPIDLMAALGASLAAVAPAAKPAKAAKAKKAVAA